MNRRISKGMAALLIMLLSLQAPVALAFACAGHFADDGTTVGITDGTTSKELAVIEKQETDCHGNTNHPEVSEIDVQSAADECCDDCSCPVATPVALAPSGINFLIVVSPENVSTPSTLLVSLHTDRILHPPIS